MENNSDDDLMSDESASDDYKDEYGNLFVFEKTIPFRAYLKDWVSLDVSQDPQIFNKLDQYSVTHTCNGRPHLFGVSKSYEEFFFAKYDFKEWYETEKQCHEVLDPLNCPSIIKLVDAFSIGQGGIIMTPFCNRYCHDALFDHIQLVMKLLLQAIKVCHDNGIAHRDIKPQNIVWKFADSGCKIVQVFLTDFGIACFDFKEYENKTIELMPGTLRYYSPEKLLGIIPPDPRVCDIFAAGVVFLELAMQTSKPAFRNGTLDEIFDVLNNFDEVVGHLLLPHTTDLLKKMLEPNYKKRITVNEALEHQFFKEKYATLREYAMDHVNVRANGLIYNPEFLVRYKLNQQSGQLQK